MFNLKIILDGLHSTGVEPVSPPWKGGILPLNYECSNCVGGFFLRDFTQIKFDLSTFWEKVRKKLQESANSNSAHPRLEGGSIKS